MERKSKNSNSAPEDFFKGGGEMGERIRAFNWAKTPLGSPETWQQSLKTAVRLMLDSRFSMFVWWSADLTYLYNDAYAPTLGAKHPEALGKSAREVWREIWANGRMSDRKPKPSSSAAKQAGMTKCCFFWSAKVMRKKLITHFHTAR